MLEDGGDFVLQVCGALLKLILCVDAEVFGFLAGVFFEFCSGLSQGLALRVHVVLQGLDALAHGLAGQPFEGIVGAAIFEIDGSECLCVALLVLFDDLGEALFLECGGLLKFGKACFEFGLYDVFVLDDLLAQKIDLLVLFGKRGVGLLKL